jgi:hypothetical protein
MSTKSTSNSFSLDLGFGSIFHAGVDYNRMNTYSKTYIWEKDNTMATVIPFKQQDTAFEPAYFKTPGKKQQ